MTVKELIEHVRFTGYGRITDERGRILADISCEFYNYARILNKDVLAREVLFVQPRIGRYPYIEIVIKAYPY